MVLEKIVVTTPEGVYKTGDEITFEAIFSGNIICQDEAVPTLTIKFGTSELYGSQHIRTGVVSENKITYKYIIDEQDGGELSLENYYGSGVTDENGNIVIIEEPEQLDGSTISVNPLIWTSGEDVTITIDDEYKMKVNGITGKNDYYIYIVNGNEEPTIEKDSYGNPSNATWTYNHYLEETGWFVENFLERNGDIYVWIAETQINYATGIKETKFMVSEYKVERPAQKKLGQRMKCYFFDDETSIHLWEPYDNKIERNIKLKIGKVTDINILKSIKNGESDCLEKLLNYAKSAEAVYTETIPLGRTETITNNIPMVNEEYFYVYMELDDENGTYYPVEDVSLYQALVGENVGKNLFDYLDDNFKWNLEEPEKQPDTTTTPENLPNAGINTVIYIAIVMLLITAVIIGNKYKKYNFEI